MTANRPLGSLLVALACIGLAPSVGAQDAEAIASQGTVPAVTRAASPTSDTNAAVRSAATNRAAEVVVTNRTVVVLRANWMGYSPAERASDATHRIDDALASGQALTVRSQRTADGYRIFVGDRPVFNLLDADADGLSDQTPDQASAAVVARLQEAFDAGREQRRPAVILWGALMALLATLCLGAVIVLSVKVADQVTRRLLRLPGVAGLHRLDDQMAEVLRRPLMGIANILVRGVLVGVVLVSIELWAAFCLHQFPMTRPWEAQVRGVGANALGFVGMGVWRALPGLVVVLVILVVVRFVSRGVGLFFLAVEQRGITVPWLHIYPDTAPSMRRLVMIGLWSLTIVVIYPYLPGSQTEVFKALGVFAGVLLSIGSSGLVSQLVSGFILVFSRVFTTGEYVRVGDVEGTVVSIGMVSTKIHTVKREEVTIPNNVLLGGTAMNFSRLARGEGVIVYTSVTIGYDTPWRQVHGLLLRAAARTGGLKQTPPPFVLQTSLADFYVEYQLNVYLEEAHRRIPVLAELRSHIQDSFNESGVQIMSPHYLGDPPAAKVVPQDDWFRPPTSAVRAPLASPDGTDPGH